MRLVLKRGECQELTKLRNWTLIYGRRKTGKTTLATNCVKYDYYTLIASSNKAIIENTVVNVDAALLEAKKVLNKGGKVIIDEFQRLPDIYYNAISTWRGGILLALGSSFGIVKKVFDRNSPLLGLMTPKKIGLIPYWETLTQIGDPILSLIYKDPWIIQFVESYGELKDRIKEFVLIAKGLIGEVFQEEERQLTETYYNILSLLAEGIWKSSELAGILQLPGGEASVSSILNKLSNMGLVQKIPTIGRGNYYKIESPAVSLILYAEAKYHVSESDTNVQELPIGREIQFAVGELLAKKYKGLLYYSHKEDIDVVIVQKNRPIWAFEVKTGEITKSEAREAVNRMSKIAPKTGLVSLKESPPDIADTSLGPKELAMIAADLSSNIV
jgi:AAA+ ATPase superfamily predicted ATPase